MDLLKKEELKEYLTELSHIVDYYNPKTEYFIAVVLLSLNALAMLAILEWGILLGLVVACVGILPTLYFALSSDKFPHSEEKALSERACILMEECIFICKHSDDASLFGTSVRILTYSSYGNIKLYHEFVSLFPHMASKKLKKLAKVKLRDR